MTEQTTEAPPAENPAPHHEPSTEKRVGVMIATPLRHFRGPEDLPPQIGRTLHELVARREEHDYEFEFVAACGGLCSARNRATHEFLKSSANWLLQWDADLHDQGNHEADAILRLLSHKQPVMGGLYCKRDPFAKRPKFVANWLPSGPAGARVQAGGLLQVAELGGGFKLYHRKALTEIRRIFGERPLADKDEGASTIMYRERETGEMICGFHQIRTVEGDLLSEDFWLDYLCRCARIPIIADTVVRLRQVEPDGTTYPAKDQAWPPIPAEDGQ